MDDVALQQHWSQHCDRIPDRRLDLDEQEGAAVREQDRFRAAQRRENADLDDIATCRRRMCSHIPDLRTNMPEDQRNKEREASRRRNAESRRTARDDQRQRER